jgi:shikimate 5-dehydrogenase
MKSKSRTLELIYGPDVTAKIHSSNLLVVGAGGIGCEVMKTLSITGFKKITIVNLVSLIVIFRSIWTQLMLAISTDSSCSEGSMSIRLNVRYLGIRSKSKILISKSKHSLEGSKRSDLVSSSSVSLTLS